MTGVFRTEGHDIYDVIVRGAGPVGQNVADHARAAGLSVAVVERELVGGECSYWACVPSKALLRPVIAVADARRVDGARQAVTGSLDTGRVFAHRDHYVTDRDDSGQARWVKSIGADLFRGHGRLDGPRKVTVTAADGTRHILAARHAVAIATGSRPVLPALEGIEAHGRGRIGTAPTPAPSPAAWSSSAVAASGWRWPRSGRVWAPR